MRRPTFLVQEDAVTLREIVELLANEPATISEIAMVTHTSHETARRLLKMLKNAGIVEKETVQREGRFGIEPVETLRWQLTSAYIAGEVAFEAESLAQKVSA